MGDAPLTTESHRCQDGLSLTLHATRLVASFPRHPGAAPPRPQRRTRTASSRAASRPRLGASCSLRVGRGPPERLGIGWFGRRHLERRLSPYHHLPAASQPAPATPRSAFFIRLRGFPHSSVRRQTPPGQKWGLCCSLLNPRHTENHSAHSLWSINM